MKDTKDSKMVRKAKMDHERKPIGDEFAINVNDLEGEAHRQLELMTRYGELSAEAKYKWERADVRKKSVRSRLILEVERDPSLLKKASKNMQSVEAYYRVHPDYKAACENLAEAVYNMELMQNAMFALSQRRDMLDLFNKRQMAMNNISTSSDREKRVTDKVKERMNKHKKGKG